MGQKPKALVGMHNPRYAKEIVDIFDRLDYEIVQSKSVEDMLQAMGLTAVSPSDLAPTTDFKWYIMDANLGEVGGESYRTAQTIYSHIQQQVKEGLTHFMALTARNDLVKTCNDTGIPCMDKMKLVELAQMIRQLG